MAFILNLPVVALGDSAGRGQSLSIKGDGGKELAEARSQQRLLTAASMAPFTPSVFQRVKGRGQLIATFNAARTALRV